MLAQLLIFTYLAFLRCFPARYRSEYGEELEYALRCSVEEARGHSRQRLVRLAWRELRDLPFAVVRSHLRERSGKSMKIIPGQHLPEGPIIRWQLAALFFPFLIPVLGFAVKRYIMPGTPVVDWVITGLLVLMSGIFVFIFAAGLIRQFPAWALPTIGIVLFGASFVLRFTASGIVLLLLSTDHLGWPETLPARFIPAVITDLLFVLLLIPMIALLLALVPAFRKRVHQDWTLLSFFFYGMAVPPILMNDPYKGLEPYGIIYTLLLAAGAIIFLTSSRRWLRLITLCAAVIFAQAVYSLGIYQIFPAQVFASPDETFRLWESIYPALALPAMLLLLCLPAILPLLPGRFTRAAAGQTSYLIK